MPAASADTVVTRFAPSPTGYLHVGGARTALFSWLLARHAGGAGKFLLRIEDTDLARSTEQATLQLLDDLRWLGLHWDNAADLVYQSRRKHVYDAIIESLVQRNLAYRAYETPEELDLLRKAAEREKRQFVYRRRDLSAEQVKQFEGEGRPHVVRFAMPVKEYRFHDEVLGKEIVLGPDEVQDFVIKKADGMPTYHFAVVVDDAEMRVTHILRGQEHTKNTFLHIALQEALGYPRPTYGHLPIIMNLDGSKMGKRDRDKKIRAATQLHLKNTRQSPSDVAAAASVAVSHFEEWLNNASKQLDLPEQSALMHVIGMTESDLPEILVHDFRRNGYFPDALLNFLALLGWSPGGDRERMTMTEMTELFSVAGIGKSNAKFDRAKLLAFNTQHGEATPAPQLVPAFRAYLEVNPDSPLQRASDDQLVKLLEMKKGFRLLREVDEASRFLFVADDQINYDPDAVEKVLRKNDRQGVTVLQELGDVLPNITDWRHETIEKIVQQYCDQKQLGLGKVAQPLRVAISGGTVSPPIFQSLDFLGRESTLARIDRCLGTAVY
ncbi:MAG TPA: glutamate--tRNA ligase [Tepidisphaeraceae bacterium]|nr:glutamate--tRNA ligase [Tepidisphaeraceae bacterium]